VAWISGSLVPAEAAVIPIDDHGLVVGDGVFETLKTVGRAPFAVRRHLARLRRSAAALGLVVPYDDDRLIEAMAAVIASSGPAGGGPGGGRGPGSGDGPAGGPGSGGGELRVRLTVTGGRSPLSSVRGDGPALVVIAASALGPRHDAATVAVVPWARNERGALAGVKSTSYAENVVALASARARGADEAVFGNTVGQLCEGTGSNVFVVLDGEVLTPPLASGCLAGVTRDLVLESGAAREADIDLERFRSADEAFLTSTTRDVQPIAAIDGRRLPLVGGPVTAAAMAAFEAAAVAER
jgi:branched-chain amino acid aminotransferase